MNWPKVSTNSVKKSTDKCIAKKYKLTKYKADLQLSASRAHTNRALTFSQPNKQEAVPGPVVPSFEIVSYNTHNTNTLIFGVAILDLL